LGRDRWDADGLDYVTEHLADENAVLVIMGQAATGCLHRRGDRQDAATIGLAASVGRRRPRLIDRKRGIHQPITSSITAAFHGIGRLVSRPKKLLPYSRIDEDKPPINAGDFALVKEARTNDHHQI
jgi:hypothetical protein